MIQNERQYEVTKKKLADLQASLEAVQAKTRPDHVPEIVWRGHQNGILALIGDLRAELDEYEKLRAGESRHFPLASVFEDLPAALVRARIARGWTHKELAKALGTTEQQVQKDEAGGYARASLDRLQRVADVLKVRIAGKAQLYVQRNGEARSRRSTGRLQKKDRATHADSENRGRS